jgi:hypothetical protein
MKQLSFLLFLVFLSVQIVLGQDNSKNIRKDTTVIAKHPKNVVRRWGDAGFGIGLDYGGVIGVKATFYPVSYMGVFAAGGWELINVGWNVGVLGRILPADGRYAARPYLKVMYGVNGATKVDQKSRYDKMFYGVTVGAGLEIRFGKKRKSGINFDLNFPFRSPEFYKQVSDMENDSEIKMQNSVLPVAFSLGYNTEF